MGSRGASSSSRGISARKVGNFDLGVNYAATAKAALARRQSSINRAIEDTRRDFATAAYETYSTEKTLEGGARKLKESKAYMTTLRRDLEKRLFNAGLEVRTKDADRYFARATNIKGLGNVGIDLPF